MKSKIKRFQKNSALRVKILKEQGVDICKADSVVELKDGRYLLKLDNGFTYWVITQKNVIEQVGLDWYKNQMKNRLTKKNKQNVKK